MGKKYEIQTSSIKGLFASSLAILQLFGACCPFARNRTISPLGTAAVQRALKSSS